MDDLGLDQLDDAPAPGKSGTWTLTAYDWWTIDSGSFTGWTLNGSDGGTSATPFCIPNASGVLACALAGCAIALGLRLSSRRTFRRLKAKYERIRNENTQNSVSASPADHG
jgi:hypothetical protein